MDGKYPRRGAGLQCLVTGTVIGNPLFKMVKNGTVPMLGLTVTYDEYDGASSACRVTLFGDQAQAIAGSLNSWEKNGEKKHGLGILAQRVRLLGDAV